MFIHFRFTTKSKDYTGNFFSSGIWGNSLSTIQMVPNCEGHFKAFQGTTSSLGSFQIWRKSHLRTSSSLGSCSFYVFRTRNIRNICKGILQHVPATNQFPRQGGCWACWIWGTGFGADMMSPWMPKVSLVGRLRCKHRLDVSLWCKCWCLKYVWSPRTIQDDQRRREQLKGSWVSCSYHLASGSKTQMIWEVRGGR